jgi:formimidoylglutamate deiminase
MALFAHDQQYILDSLMFASQTNMVRDVMVNGQWVIENGQHQQEQLIANNFAEMLAQLAS